MIKLNSINPGKLVALGLATVIVLGGGGLYLSKRHNNQTKAPTLIPPTGNLVPATEEEKQQNANNKDRIVKEQNNAQNQSTPDPTNPNPVKKTVSVSITHASASSVNAYVTGVFEEGGTCTATFTQNSTVVTRTAEGFGNVSYTQCAPITPNLPSGSWSVVVSYSSAAAEGTSKAQTF